MRGIKTHDWLRVVAAGDAFVQNVRRGRSEIATLTCGDRDTVTRGLQHVLTLSPPLA